MGRLVVITVVALAFVAGTVGFSLAQDQEEALETGEETCATPLAEGSPDALGSPVPATPIVVVEATPGMDPGEASPTTEVICATPGTGTPGIGTPEAGTPAS